MAHIFVSYAREDVETAKRLAAEFRARGWRVWWDTRLKAGEVWDKVIEQALEDSCCVVVLWSPISVDKHWVREEASFGRERKMLVPAVIQTVRPPIGFRTLNYEDLTGWRGEDDHRNLLRLLEAVAGFVGDASAPAAPPAVAVSAILPTSTGHPTGRDSIGRWLDLAVPAKSAPVVQRFRWIAPGSFLMGSPENEPERRANEGPRHRVTLTRGFWLADTACTQALWETVMGDNLSRFRSADRPVERVSWDDVQHFLTALNERLPGIGAGLPTEAEWEYACRAGTDTPFSFGPQITPEQVNYDGNRPYADGKKGMYRKQAVAVKSLLPNAWGLYEMHGNVWEWCADEQRTYNNEPQADPFGDPGEGETARRAVRGGSWLDLAGKVRSAYRGAIPPGHAYYTLGFRLSLRSIETAPA